MMHNESGKKTICVLTCLGLLPFLASVFLIISPVKGISVAVVYQLASNYAAVILSFLAGSHWGLQLQRNDTPLNGLLYFSNIIALLAWGGLMASIPSRFIIFLLGFLFQLGVDIKLSKMGVYPTWYFSLRLFVTLTVAVCLLYHICIVL